MRTSVTPDEGYGVSQGPAGPHLASGAARIWTPHWLAPLPRPARIAVRTVVLFILAIFLAWLVLYVTKGRFLKHPFEKIASHALERDVRVGGDFNLYFDPIDVKFLAEDLHISNPKWAREKDFFAARRIATRIRTVPLIFGRERVKWIALDEGHMALEWDQAGNRNTWTFGSPDQKGKPLKLPSIERGLVTGSRLQYRDPKLQLFADIGIDTVKALDTQFANSIGFSGGGTMRAKPFKLSGSLLSPNETANGGQNKLKLHADAADTRLDVSGTLPGATEIKGANLDFRVAGANIANLFDFLGIAIPETRRYHIASDLTYDGEDWRFTRLRGVFGDSDIGGSMRIGMPKNRLKLTADLSTRSLDIIDAGPFVGYDPKRLDAMGGKGAVTQSGGHPTVLPDAPLRIDALKRFDADVRYRVRTVKAQNFPLSDIDVTLGLDHSRLTLDPATANLSGGKLTADITLDARRSPVQTDYDIHLSPTPMGTLLARFGVSESGTTGTLSARAQMKGSGDSIAESLAHSTGRIAVIIPHGTMWTRNIQLSELDIGTFVQKMFEKKLKDPVEINCGLLAFTVHDGIAAADPVIIDTKKNVILGRGGFSFRNEAIDMAVRADSKTFSLFSAQSPVNVGGWFAAPKVDPISPQLIERAGAGLGLGLFASPIAGILAFVDPGDAKSTACGPVLAGAHASAMRTTKGKPRDDVGNGTTAKSESGKQSAGDKHKQRKKFLGIF